MADRFSVVVEHSSVSREENRVNVEPIALKSDRSSVNVERWIVTRNQASKAPSSRFRGSVLSN